LREINPLASCPPRRLAPLQTPAMHTPAATADATPPIDRTLINALREQLRSQCSQPVTLIETHISWVLLAGERAYKVKKPVRLPFVDFSTLDARRRFCELELRLNQRLAPQLYLEVLPVCGTPASPRLGGAGEPIDYAVCMRRFAAGALLSEQWAAGRLQARQIEQLADALAAFHERAPVAEAATPWGTPAQIVQAARDVLGSLQPLVAAGAIDTLRGWLAERKRTLTPVWTERRATGAVRECHGDLHLANAAQVGDEVLAFDCIEFDPAMRWIDVASDLAFLTMDLQAHGRSDLAARALDAWLQRSGDFAALRVLRFYEVYRAMVRALVAALRASQPSAPDAAAVPPQPADADPDHLAFALAAAQARPAPRLLITHGLSGCGKSSVALQLLERTGAVRLRSDVERKRLFGLGALERSAARSLDVYTAHATRRTFDRLAELARTALRAGWPVIVDAAFLHRGERRAFRALAAELGVPFAILHCHAPEAVLRERVAARSAAGNDASEADVAVLQRQIDAHEPLDADERAIALEVATDGAVDAAALAARWLAGA
jgi:aminoglycoside phosphotransferase family enzyme/predicted kinase